ncbi:MAG: multidrug effflux MFS transporter [Deltaproteobacteria bacterium]|jgi:DHA1 family bicyclomycin/chloramphenicol resistance-like MFS transporter|nr:multidrug effflux MFS transporter [Deltaproteobacteria bacterium]
MKDDLTLPARGKPGSGLARLVILLGLLNSFGPFSIDMYLSAFPTMANDMGTTQGGIQLTLSVFFFGLAAGQMFYGPISDRFGRRGPLVVGLLLYLAASWGLVFVRDIHAFIALRFAQALGGSAGMVISRAVVRDSFGVTDSAKVLTAIMAVQTIGPVAAPVLGAWFVTFWSWGACFVFTGFLGILALLLTLAFLWETHPRDSRVKRPPAGILRDLAGLLRKRSYLGPALASAMGSGSIFSFISASPYILIEIYGLSPSFYAYSFAGLSVAVAIVSQANFLLLRYHSARTLVLAGFGVMAFFGSIAAVFVALWGMPCYAAFMAMLFLSVMSMPLVTANSTALAMAGSGGMAGLASSLVGVLQFAFAALITFLVGALSWLVDFPMAFLIALCGVGGFTFTYLAGAVE